MDALITEKQLLVHLSISRATLWRKVRRGEFPPPREISIGRKGWKESDVSDWIDSRPVAAPYTNCGYEPQGNTNRDS